MDKLLKSLSKVEPALAIKYSALSLFTLYAVEYRYPDVDLKLKPLTVEICQNAIALAKQVFEDLSLLSSPSLPLE